MIRDLTELQINGGSDNEVVDALKADNQDCLEPCWKLYETQSNGWAIVDENCHSDPWRAFLLQKENKQAAIDFLNTHQINWHEEK